VSINTIQDILFDIFMAFFEVEVVPTQ
jgi:hypothetical protein